MFRCTFHTFKVPLFSSPTFYSPGFSASPSALSTNHVIHIQAMKSILHPSSHCQHAWAICIRRNASGSMPLRLALGLGLGWGIGLGIGLGLGSGFDYFRQCAICIAPKTESRMHVSLCRASSMVQGDRYCQLSVKAKTFKLSSEYLHIYKLQPQKCRFRRKTIAKLHH